MSSVVMPSAWSVPRRWTMKVGLDAPLGPAPDVGLRNSLAWAGSWAWAVAATRARARSAMGFFICLLGEWFEFDGAAGFRGGAGGVEDLHDDEVGVECGEIALGFD